jgi:2-methylcitrate dehydratase PrpD
MLMMQGFNMKSDRVVQFVIEAGSRSLRGEVQHQARRRLLDALGALIAGTQAPVAAMTADLAASQYDGSQATHKPKIAGPDREAGPKRNKITS